MSGGDVFGDWGLIGADLVVEKSVIYELILEKGTESGMINIRRWSMEALMSILDFMGSEMISVVVNGGRSNHQ